MSRAVRRLFLAVVLLPAGPGLAMAQLPPVTPEQAAQGARVVGARFEPGDLSLNRNDTARVRIILLDGDHQPVDGVLAFLFSPDPAVAGPQVTPRGPDETVALRGMGPGRVETVIVVRVNEADGSFQGLSGIKQVGTLPVTVREYPVDRVEIATPAYRPYAGTTFKLAARALTTHGTESETARVAWKSENPTIATVTPGGVVMPVKPGRATLVASAGDGKTARTTIEVLPNPVADLRITPASVETRTGDVVRFDVKALDRQGRPVEGVAMAYAVSGLDSAGATVYGDGAFVAENPGAYRVLVSSGGRTAEAVVEATPRPAAAHVRKVGHGARTKVATSDLWVFTGKDGRDYAYTGTHANGGGQRMFAWDVTDPSDIRLMDSVVVDARVVNDVKVSGDASWAIITREGASNRRNGIVVLDLADPAHPKVIAELTDSLTSGIHNVWINGNIVYAVNDGTSALNILDLSDPAQPKNLGRFEIRPGETDKSLHDVWSDGQFLYISYWDDGLVIADVSGRFGGTPTAPKLVSGIRYAQGNTHVAWREGDYVFVGDEIFGCAECVNGPRGYIHVIDVKDIERPREVARFEVPEAGTHNIWVENGRLYIAYYQGGLRVVDVSGELRGDLYRQGRQVGWIQTGAGADEALVPNSAMAWGPQPFKGHIFVSDMNSGLWAVKMDESRPATP